MENETKPDEPESQEKAPQRKKPYWENGPYQYKSYEMEPFDGQERKLY